MSRRHSSASSVPRREDTPKRNIYEPNRIHRGPVQSIVVGFHILTTWDVQGHPAINRLLAVTNVILVQLSPKSIASAGTVHDDLFDSGPIATAIWLVPPRLVEYEYT